VNVRQGQVKARAWTSTWRPVQARHNPSNGSTYYFSPNGLYSVKLPTAAIIISHLTRELSRADP